MDQIRGKMDFIEQLKQIAVLTRRWPGALTKVVEDAADAQAVKSTLDGTVPGIVLVRAHGSKEARLAGVVGAIESGNVYLARKRSLAKRFRRRAHDVSGNRERRSSGRLDFGA